MPVRSGPIQDHCRSTICASLPLPRLPARYRHWQRPHYGRSQTVIGETQSFAAAGGSGMRAIRNFRPHCGSLMFGTPEAAADLVTISMDSLDDPSIRAPTYAQFTRDRVSWDVMVCGAPEFHTLPPRHDNDA